MNELNLVEVMNNEVVTTSRQVAEVFKKEHRNVMKDIRELRSMLKSEDCSNFNSPQTERFEETTYRNSQNKQQPMYIMNRDGFALLAMGYTGKRALAFKLEFIKAFDEMEKRLQSNYFLEILDKIKRIKNDDVNYYVYLINEKGTNNYKIGVSSNISRRLPQLQIGNPNLLIMTAKTNKMDRYKAYSLEAKLHNLLKDKQATNEWFELSENDIQIIKFSFDVIDD